MLRIACEPNHPQAAHSACEIDTGLRKPRPVIVHERHLRCEDSPNGHAMPEAICIHRSSQLSPQTKPRWAEECVEHLEVTAENIKKAG